MEERGGIRGRGGGSQQGIVCKSRVVKGTAIRANVFHAPLSDGSIGDQKDVRRRATASSEYKTAHTTRNEKSRTLGAESRAARVLAGKAKGLPETRARIPRKIRLIFRKGIHTR